MYVLVVMLFLREADLKCDRLRVVANKLTLEALKDRSLRLEAELAFVDTTDANLAFGIGTDDMLDEFITELTFEATDDLLGGLVTELTFEGTDDLMGGRRFELTFDGTDDLLGEIVTDVAFEGTDELLLVAELAFEDTEDLLGRMASELKVEGTDDLRRRLATELVLERMGDSLHETEPVFECAVAELLGSAELAFALPLSGLSLSPFSESMRSIEEWG